MRIEPGYVQCDSQVENFKRNVYDKCSKTILNHITSTIPEKLESHGSHGQNELQVFVDHYDPHNVINCEEAKSKIKVFNSVLAEVTSFSVAVAV